MSTYRSGVTEPTPPTHTDLGPGSREERFTSCLPPQESDDPATLNRKRISAAWQVRTPLSNLACVLVHSDQTAEITLAD